MVFFILMYISLFEFFLGGRILNYERFCRVLVILVVLVNKMKFLKMCMYFVIVERISLFICKIYFCRNIFMNNFINNLNGKLMFVFFNDNGIGGEEGVSYCLSMN